MSKLLVTGGNGFLGRNLARNLKGKYDICLGSRNNKVNFDAGDYSGCRVVPLDVTNIESVRDVVYSFKPDIILHAAATKFVDLSETYPMECIDVNVIGSQNVARVAIESGVVSVLGVSTDKAVSPARNLYGLSKALMERLFASLNQTSSTNFACMRYGNVAWSTYSVLPVWEKMSQQGTISVSGIGMSRFIITIDQAVNYINCALDNMNKIAGSTLCPIMKSAMIEDLLEVWLNMKGGSWKGVPVRPGESTYECLITDKEIPYTEKIKINNQDFYLRHYQELTSAPIEKHVNSNNSQRLSVEELRTIIESRPTYAQTV